MLIVIFLLENVLNMNAQCLQEYTYTMGPPPIDGTYGPNETVEFCFTIDEWSTNSGQWFHGIELDFGEGWDMSTITTIPANDIGNQGTWGWYPNGINGGYGSGFYFNYTFPMDMNPANNYGDLADGPWTFCWTITTADGSDLSLDGASLDITVNTLGDGESGSYFIIGCTNDLTIDPPFVSVLNLCDLNAGENSTISVCSNASNFAVFDSLAGDPDTGGSWLNPNNNPFSGIFNPDISLEGVYTYTLQNFDCTVSSTVEVLISNQPTSTISGGANICNGENTTLTITSTGTAPFDVVYADGNNNFLLNNIPSTYNFIVSPSLNTTYALLTSNDNTNLCEGIVAGIAQVNVANIPTGNISGGGTFCLGEAGDIIFDITGGASYNLTYWDGAIENNLTNVEDGDIVSFTPPFNSTFTLVEIYPVGFPSCTAEILTGNAPFIVTVAPVVTNLVESCNQENESYLVTFTINGGDINSYFEENNLGNISTNIFTSELIANGLDYSFSIDDENLCGPIVIEGNYFCPCISQVGSMNLTAIEICTNQIAVGDYDNTGEDLDGNDNLLFILHDNAGDSLGNIVTTSLIPSIAFDDLLMNANTQYYISAVVGNVDYLNDPCLSIASGTPLIFNNAPSATIDGSYEFCEGSSIDLNVVFTGDIPFEFNYAINGMEAGTLVSNNLNYALNTSIEGQYQITSVSSNGCSSEEFGIAEVSETSAPFAAFVGEENICSNNNNGLEINLDGSSPFTLTYSIGGVLQPEVFTNNANYFLPVNSSDNYSLNFIEDNNCGFALSDSLEVTLLSPPTAEITGGGEICQGGQVEFTVSINGVAPFDLVYAINGLNQSVSAIDNVYTFLSGTSGTYSIINLQDQFCQGIVIGDNAALVVNPLPLASIAVSENPICEGDATSIVFNLNGNSTAFDVLYSINGTEQLLDNISNGYILELPPQEVSSAINVINITDNSINACSNNINSITNILVNNYPIIPPFESLKICSGAEPIAIGIYAEASVSYQWDPTVGVGNPNNSYTGFTPQSSSTTPISTIYTLIGSIGNCLSQQTLNITVYPLPNPLFSYQPKAVTTENTLVNFTNNTLGKNSYYWNFDDLSFSNEENPSYEFPDAIEGIYLVELTATDTAIGCTGKTDETIFIKGDLLVYIPTAFTPNGDGVNDLLKVSIENFDPSYFHFKIFDRWGEQVFETYNAESKWDGSQNGKSYYNQPQVYNWTLESKNRFSPAIKTYNGTVTIVR